jgi:hypothetical protein
MDKKIVTGQAENDIYTLDQLTELLLLELRALKEDERRIIREKMRWDLLYDRKIKWDVIH